MSDLLVGIGLVLVIEGLLWAMAPGMAMRMLEAAAQSRETALRVAGLIAMIVGVAIVWFVRG